MDPGISTGVTSRYGSINAWKAPSVDSPESCSSHRGGSSTKSRSQERMPLKIVTSSQSPRAFPPTCRRRCPNAQSGSTGSSSSASMARTERSPTVKGTFVVRSSVLLWTRSGSISHAAVRGATHTVRGATHTVRCGRDAERQLVPHLGGRWLHRLFRSALRLHSSRSPHRAADLARVPLLAENLRQSQPGSPRRRGRVRSVLVIRRFNRRWRPVDPGDPRGCVYRSIGHLVRRPRQAALPVFGRYRLAARDP